jgi:hypothetical protein
VIKNDLKSSSADEERRIGREERRIGREGRGGEELFFLSC